MSLFPAPNTKAQNFATWVVVCLLIVFLSASTVAVVGLTLRTTTVVHTSRSSSPVTIPIIPPNNTTGNPPSNTTGNPPTGTTQPNSANLPTNSATLPNRSVPANPTTGSTPPNPTTLPSNPITAPNNPRPMGLNESKKNK